MFTFVGNITQFPSYKFPKNLETYGSYACFPCVFLLFSSFKRVSCLSEFISHFAALLIVCQIIMPNTACENPSTLFKFLSDQLPYANLSSVQRKYFNEAKGNLQFPMHCKVKCHLLTLRCYPIIINILKDKDQP